MDENSPSLSLIPTLPDPHSNPNIGSSFHDTEAHGQRLRGVPDESIQRSLNFRQQLSSLHGNDVIANNKKSSAGPSNSSFSMQLRNLSGNK
jgi:hypothetical protein